MRQFAQASGLANGVLYGSQALFPFIAQAVNHLAPPAAIFHGYGLVALAIGLAYLMLN